METDITQLKSIKERAAQAANPFSATLLPIGLMVVVTGVIPLSISIGYRLFCMISLYALGILLTYFVQKYYSKRLGAAIPEEDQLTYLIRNSGFLVFIFFTLNIYASLFEDFGAWEYVVKTLGVIGFIAFITLSLIYTIRVFNIKRGNNLSKFEKIFDYRGTILLYFAVTWITSEGMSFDNKFSSLPIYLALAGPALFFITVWLHNTKKNKIYLLLGCFLIVMSLSIGMLFNSMLLSIPFVSQVVFNLSFIMNLSLIRVHWVILGLCILILGVIEHNKLMNLFPKSTHD